MHDYFFTIFNLNCEKSFDDVILEPLLGINNNSAFGIKEKNIRIWRLVAHFGDLLHGR